MFGHIQHPEREDHVCGNIHFESDIRLLLSEARPLAILSLLDGRLVKMIDRCRSNRFDIGRRQLSSVELDWGKGERSGIPAEGTVDRNRLPIDPVLRNVFDEDKGYL